MNLIEEKRTVSERTLFVDLDKTLLCVDSLWEQAFMFLQSSAGALWMMIYWLVKGKAYLKQQLSKHYEIDPSTLPYREEVVSMIQSERNKGRQVVLATASDRSVAERIANHLGLFSDIIASDGQKNLKGRDKLNAIRNLVGDDHHFDYIGDNHADLPIWEKATNAIVVTS